MQSELIPRAILGLKSLGVTTCDTEDFLDIILQRVINRQNGCQWQRQFIESRRQDIALTKNFKLMTETYLKHQQSGSPVSEWSNI